MQIKKKIIHLLVLLPYIQYIIIIVIYKTDPTKIGRYSGNGVIEGLHFFF